MKTWNIEHKAFQEKLMEKYGILTETKDHLINRLENLSDEEKQQAIEFFRRHPDAESRIDWNKKDLVFDDFKKLIDFEGTGKRATLKAGLAGLKEGEDYLSVENETGYNIYIPYTLDAARIIAPPKTEWDWYECIHDRDGLLVYVYEGDKGKWIVERSDNNDVYYRDDDYEAEYDIIFKDWKGNVLEFPENKELPEPFLDILSWIDEDDSDSVEKGNRIQAAKDKEREQRWLKNPVVGVKVKDGEKICTGIPDYADAFEIKKVIIPRGITRIGNDAFRDCSRLKNIVIPEGVTSIGRGAFANCGISSIKIPSSVMSIEARAFYRSRLKSIVIPEGVTSIAKETFWDCNNLTSVVIPDSVTNIEPSAFASCDGLVTIDIPNSVTSIGSGAFGLCDRLTNVNIPDSVTTMHSYVFHDCYKLTNVKLPNNIKRIEYSTFEGCTSLVNIDIPDSVRSIEKKAFCRCRSLTSITIPEGVTNIDGYAFENCEELTNIEIPNSMKYIGVYAFRGCNKLNSITVPKDCKVEDPLGWKGTIIRK